MQRSRVVFAALLAAVALPICASAQAQTGDALNLYVPPHAGRGAAIVAATIAPALAKALGRGVTIMSGDAPDGPHFLMDSSQSQGHFVKTRAASSGVAVALVGTSPMVLVGRRDLDVDDGADAIQALRADASRFTFGIDAPGGDADSCMRVLIQSTGTTIKTKPSNRGGELADLSSDFTCAPAPVVHQPVHTGGVRGFVVAADERVSSLWDVTAAPESGAPLFSATAWFGIAATASMSASDVERVNAAVQKLFADDATIQKLADIGVTPVATMYRSTAAYRGFLDGETQRMTTLFAD